MKPKQGPTPGAFCRGREARRADLDRQIAALTVQEEALRVDWATVKTRLMERVVDWRGLLRSHVPQARQLLRKLLTGPIRFTPVKGGYRFEAKIALGSILLGIIDPTSVASPTGTVGRWSRPWAGFSDLAA
jgi:hypothetical protein